MVPENKQPMSKQTHIFATHSDLEPGLKEFESKNKVKYARCDLYYGPIYEQYLSLLDWTDLGRNTTGDHVRGPRFLIVRFLETAKSMLNLFRRLPGPR